jgi:hypothetical protein
LAFRKYWEPRAPEQRAYIERVIGTIRRESLDHVIVFNEASLHRHLKLFLEYYHGTRTHLLLEKDTPGSRSVQPPESGPVLAVPQVDRPGASAEPQRAEGDRFGCPRCSTFARDMQPKRAALDGTFRTGGIRAIVSAASRPKGRARARGLMPWA